MGHRTLAFVFGVATALTAQIAVALGLGEIKLNSTLNQPLDAEIQLLQVRDLSEQEILVGLASLEDFQRVGVERPFFLSDLNFDVDLSNPRDPVVHVTSRQPVREPFLNFVVQAQWPSGRLLREYTLLMDLPVFAEERQAQQPVQPAQQQAEQPSQGQSATPSRQTPRQAQQQPERQTQQATGGANYGPVNASDTLWNIAAATRPEGVSVQQAMIAIQRANPGAFITRNINLLREGQVLRIPTPAEMAAVTGQEAVDEVALQNQSWANRGASEAQGAQLEGSQSYTARDDQPEQPEGRVKLASPENISASAEGRGTGEGGGDTEALENELAATLEELDRSQSENAELKSRIEAMEEQIATMERLVDVSSEEMRALQLASQQTNEQNAEVADSEAAPAAEEPDVTTAEGEPTDQAASAEQPTADADADAAQEADAAEPAAPVDEIAEQEQVQEPEEQVARDPTRVVAAPPQSESLLDLLMENLIFIGLGLVAVLVAVALFLRSRKSKQDGYEEDDFLTEPEGSYLDEESYDSVQDEDDWQPEEQSAEDEQALFAEDEEEHAQQETEDAVAEAEIYIALAKYDQAEEILLRALENTPEDTAIRLKLLELYAVQQDLDNFDAQYARLLLLNDDKATARAEELRERFEGAPEFDPSRHNTGDFATSLGGVAAASAAGVAAGRDESADYDDELDLSFDDGDAFPDATEENLLLDEEINNSLNATDEDMSDFDLDLDLGEGESTEEDEPVTLVDQAEDIDFNFDLDLDEEEPTEGEGDTPAELEVSDEFNIELGLADTDDDEDDDSTLVRPAIEEPQAAEDDLTFDFDLDSDEAASDSQADLNEQLESELESSQVVETSTEENDDDGSIEWDIESPESATEAVEKSFATASSVHTDQGDQDDDLNLDADMDLSALDQELDAMTSDFEVDEGDLEEPSANREPSAPSQEPSTPSQSATEDQGPLTDEEFDLSLDDEQQASEPAAFEERRQPTETDDLATQSMDEPETDFDDLDSLMDSGETSNETPAWQRDVETLQEEPSADLEEPSAEVEEPSAPMEEPSAEVEEPSAEVNPADAEQPEESSVTGTRQSTDSDVATDAFDDFDLDDIDPEAEGDDDLAFLSDSDETATKLDLARAYIDMGDRDGAKDILDEIMQEGSDDQRKEAQSLLERV